MTTVAQLQRRVKRLEQTLTPKPPDDIVVIFSFGPDEESHGKYGHRKRHMLTGEVEPVDEEDEIGMLRDYYETQIPRHCKKADGVYPTFEFFLRSHECKCGRQHPYTNPEHKFTNKWQS
jgi:hypothetical protein